MWPKCNSILAVCFLLIFGCASGKMDNPKQPIEKKDYAEMYRVAIEQKQCAEAQKIIPLEQSSEKSLSIIQSSIGHIVTLSVSPVTLGIDVILMGRPHGRQNTDDEILKILFPMSGNLYEDSKKYRCPKNNYYIEKMLEITECYLGKDSEENHKAGMTLLEYLFQSSDKTFTCVNKTDRQKIHEMYARVHGK